VATELTDSFTLVNQLDKPVAYEVSVPIDDDAFACTRAPGTRRAGAARVARPINLTFVLNYTCKVWRYIKVTCDDVAGFYAVPIFLEGEPSSRLDPNGIELFSKPIGDGAFGVVYRGRWRGADIAVKVPKRQGEMGDAHLKAFKEEIALFEKLRNPYIVGFVGASHVPGKLCLCTELLERGTVLSLLQKAKLSLVLKVKLMLDMAHALAFLHQNGVLYRDLKTENLLVFSVSHTAPVNCKLADFGSAIAVTDPSTPLEHSRHVGTPIYMAPEVMNGEPYMSAIDIYSLAIIMWEMLAETQPYAQVKRLWELPKLVLEGARPALQEEWDEQLCELISRCWLHTPTRRPSAPTGGDGARADLGAPEEGVRSDQEDEEEERRPRAACCRSSRSTRASWTSCSRSTK
jgi:serine/threonine protein kinase